MLAVDIKDRVVGVYAAHTPQAGQRVGTRGHQFGGAVLGEEVHHHEDVLRADRQIHCATHGGDGVGHTRVPVGQIAMAADLERAEHTHIEVPTAHRRERV